MHQNSLILKPVCSYLMVAVFAGLVMFINLGGKSFEGHESLVAVTSDNIESDTGWIDPENVTFKVPPRTNFNRWMIPVFNGRPRLVKPPFAYWCVGLLKKSGMEINEFTVRIPSALAGVLLSLVVLKLGRSMFSARAGLSAGLCCALSIGIVQWSRSARPDMLMTFWMTFSIAFIYFAYVAKTIWGKIGWFALAGIIAGIAGLCKQYVPLLSLFSFVIFLCYESSCKQFNNLSKPRNRFIIYLVAAYVGLVILLSVQEFSTLHWWTHLSIKPDLGRLITLAVCIGGPVAWYWFTSRAWNSTLRHAPGMILMFVIAMVMFGFWYLYIKKPIPEVQEIVKNQSFSRALGTGGWPVKAAGVLSGYYLISIAKFTASWCLFIPGAIVIPFRNKSTKTNKQLMFCMSWIFGLVILFSASCGTRSHYILPAVSAFCLLIGFCVDDLFFEHKFFSIKIEKTVCLAYALTAVGGFIATLVALFIVDDQTRLKTLHIMCLCIIGSVVFGFGARSAFKLKHSAAWASLMIGLLLCTSGFVAFNGLWDRRKSLQQFVAAVKQNIGSDQTLVSWDRVNSSIVYYYGQEIPDVLRRKEVQIHRHGLQKGTASWQKWLKDKTKKKWLMIEHENIPQGQQLGFKVLPFDRVITKGNDDLVIMELEK